jgi:hypothetical protein
MRAEEKLRKWDIKVFGEHKVAGSEVKEEDVDVEDDSEGGEE